MASASAPCGSIPLKIPKSETGKNEPVHDIALFDPSPGESTRLGKAVPGAPLSGAEALQTVIATSRITYEAIEVNVPWNALSICERIIPNPTPPNVSRAPSHSHNTIPAKGASDKFSSPRDPGANA